MRVEFQRLRFLVVDDDAPVRRILRAMLEGFGSREVYEAADGAEGLQAFATLSPDIVITDWEMPGLDGLALTRRVRDPQTSPNPFAPVIMVTGYGERRRVLQARSAGISEYLVKPVSPRALYERILGVVARPRSFVRGPGYFGPEPREPSTVSSGSPLSGRTDS